MVILVDLSVCVLVYWSNTLGQSDTEGNILTAVK